MKNYNKLPERVILTNFGDLPVETSTQLFLRLIEKFEDRLDVSEVAMEILGQGERYTPSHNKVAINDSVETKFTYKEIGTFVGYDNFSPRSESVEYETHVERTGWVQTEEQAERIKKFQSFSGIESSAVKTEQHTIKAGYEYTTKSHCSPETWESYKPLPPF